jgi:membrane protein YdbS with pleckstrin-like domain
VIEAGTRPLLRVLRVPPEPHLPAGEPGSARVFRAGLNYWRLRLAQWVARQLFTVAGFVFLMVLLQAVPDTITLKNKGKSKPLSVAPMISWVKGLEVLAWGLWLVQLPLTFAVIRLDYELRWYIVTDRAARLREGVLSMTEMTFTLANVQDIRILQGPLQRLLGLSDVELRTAGGGDTSPTAGRHGAGITQNLHLARFRGVDNGMVIRDLVLERMKKARGAGLGDPDDAPAAEPVSVPQTLDAATRELAAASSALREAVRSL